MDRELEGLLRQAVEEVEPTVLSFRRQLHRRPELGFETFETMGRIAGI